MVKKPDLKSPADGPVERGGDPIFGLLGIAHSGAGVLTIMSAAGVTALEKRLDFDGFVVYGGGDRLLHLHEQRDGAADEFVRRYGVRVLDKADWDRHKKQLGSAVLR